MKRYVTTVEPSVSKRLSSANDLRVAKTSPVMEKVTILIRGESLDLKIKSESRKEAFCFYPPFFLIFLLGLFLFAFDDDIYLFFNGRHRSYHSKDLKSRLLLQLQYRKKKGE